MSVLSRIGMRPVAVAVIAAMALGLSLVQAVVVANEMTASDPIYPVSHALGVPFMTDISATDGSTQYDSYTYEVKWDPTILAPTGTVDQSGSAGLGFSLPQTPSVGANYVVSGAASATGPIAATGSLEAIELVCIAPGVSFFNLTAYNPGPPKSGTYMSDTTAADPIITPKLVNGYIACNYKSDLVVVKTDDLDPMLAGGTITYTIDVHNAGPNPSPAIVIADSVDVSKTVQGTPGMAGGGTVVYPSGVSLKVAGTPIVPAPCIWKDSFTYPGLGTFPNVVICDFTGALLTSLPPPLVGTNAEVFTTTAGSCNMTTDLICTGTSTGTLTGTTLSGTIADTWQADWNGWTPGHPCAKVTGGVGGAITGAVSGEFCETPAGPGTHSMDLTVQTAAPIMSVLHITGPCTQTAGTPSPDDDVFTCTSAYTGTIILGMSQHAVLTILADVPLSDAGKKNFNMALAADLVGDDPNGSDEKPDCDLVPIPTADISLGCEYTDVSPADVSIRKSGLPNPAIGPGPVTWTVVVTNAGPSPASAVIIEDDVTPVAGTLITSATIAGTSTGAVCFETGTTSAAILDATGASAVDVRCTLGTPNDPTKVDLAASGAAATETLTVVQNFSETFLGNCADTGKVTWADPKSASASASVSCVPPKVVKAIDKGSDANPDPVVLTVGQSAWVVVTETVEIVTPGVAPSPVLFHTWQVYVPGGSSAVGFDWDQVGGQIPGESSGGTEVGAGTSNSTLNWISTGHTTPGLVTLWRDVLVTCKGETTLLGPGGFLDVSVALDFEDASAAQPDEVSPTSFKVGCVGAPAQVKSPDLDVLWIMRHANCRNPATGHYDIGPCANPKAGIGWLQIDENATGVWDVDSPNDSDPYPEGMGAYEFQVKFDHKILDLGIVDGGFLDNNGRTPICDLTIVTENWIMFGCVSKGDPNQGVMAPGPVSLAKINVFPEGDLSSRMRPTKDNGVVTTLLDENCEWADTYGEPLPGMVDGGLVPVCGNSTITIRMLEGDLNLDCNVDVLDDQAIAFRYGASFGLLLYNPFYDLEPKVGDFDIDIKDLQFVFGRNGSTCAAPIPSGQGPLAPPP